MAGLGPPPPAEQVPPHAEHRVEPTWSLGMLHPRRSLVLHPGTVRTKKGRQSSTPSSRAGGPAGMVAMIPWSRQLRSSASPPFSGFALSSIERARLTSPSLARERILRPQPAKQTSAPLTNDHTVCGAWLSSPAGVVVFVPAGPQDVDCCRSHETAVQGSRPFANRIGRARLPSRNELQCARARNRPGRSSTGGPRCFAQSSALPFPEGPQRR